MNKLVFAVLVTAGVGSVPATAQTVVKRTVVHTTTTHAAVRYRTVCHHEWRDHRSVNVCHRVRY